MLPALEHLMAQPTTPGYLRTIVLLTDGCLGNEEQIFAALKQKLGEARLFTVAIGSAPNHFLATKMAQYGRGTFSHIADGTEIVPQMARLLDQIESPVVSDLQLRISGVDARDILPSRLPDLFMAQPLVIYGRLAGPGAGIVHLEGRAGPAAWMQEIPFDTERAAFHPGITTLWARQRIEERLEAWREAVGPEDKERLRQEIVGDAVRYRLVTRFTSLVAVEDVVVNPGGDSGLAVVPTELPAGWDREKVFGDNPVGGTADAFLEALALLLCALGLTAGLLSESVRQRLLARVRA
jgi:Ca-activated chloride channel family protein